MAIAVRERAVAAAPPGSDSPARNGEADEPREPSGQRIPKRTAWVDLRGDYGAVGMKMRVVTNYSYGQSLALRWAAGPAAFHQVIRAVVLEHSGWLCAGGELPRCPGGEPKGDGATSCPGGELLLGPPCEGGEPLPDVQTPGFWSSDQVSDELLQVVLDTLFFDVPVLYPKELRTNGTR